MKQNQLTKHILLLEMVKHYDNRVYARIPLHLDRGLKQIFPNFIPVNLAKYGVTIICKYSKDMNFEYLQMIVTPYFAK